MNHKEAKFVQQDIEDLGVQADGKLHPPAPPDDGKKSGETDSSATHQESVENRSQNNKPDAKSSTSKSGGKDEPEEKATATDKPNNPDQPDRKSAADESNSGGDQHDGSGDTDDAPGGVNEVADYDSTPEDAAEKYGRHLMGEIHMSKLEHQENERELLDELIEAILILARRFDAMAAKDEPASRPAPGFPMRHGMSAMGAFNAGMRSSMAGSMANHPGVLMQHKAHPLPPHHLTGEEKKPEEKPAKEPTPITRQFGVVHVHGSVKLIHNRKEIIRDIGYRANDYADREVVKGLPEKKDDSEEE